MGFENYKGSIRMGAGMKPEADGYPLMQTCDIQADPDGKRLDVLLAELSGGGGNDSQNVNQVVTTSGTGNYYVATVEGIDELKAGISFIMIPHITSTSQKPTLSVNELGAKGIRRLASSSTNSVVELSSEDSLRSGIPVRLMYNGTYWIVEGNTRPQANDIYGAIPIDIGGVPLSDIDNKGQTLVVGDDGLPTWKKVNMEGIADAIHSLDDETELTADEGGISWINTIEFVSETKETPIQSSHHLPIVAGDNLSFEVDEENRLVKINADLTDIVGAINELNNGKMPYVEVYTDYKDVLETIRSGIEAATGNQETLCFVRLTGYYTKSLIMHFQYRGYYDVTCLDFSTLKLIQTPVYIELSQITIEALLANPVASNVPYQTKDDENLEVGDGNVVDAINKVNSKTVDKVKLCVTPKETSANSVTYNNDTYGIHWLDEVSLRDEKGEDISQATVHRIVPICEGDNISFDVDSVNKRVKINAENTIDKVNFCSTPICGTSVVYNDSYGISWVDTVALKDKGQNEISRVPVHRTAPLYEGNGISFEVDEDKKRLTIHAIPVENNLDKVNYIYTDEVARTSVGYITKSPSGDSNPGLYWYDKMRFSNVTADGAENIITPWMEHYVPIIAGQNIVFDVDAESRTIEISSNGLPISGGTMTGELIVNGGDQPGCSKIVLANGIGQITNKGNTTLFGFGNSSSIYVGGGAYNLVMRGAGTRPSYNGQPLALLSDIPQYDNAEEVSF